MFEVRNIHEYAKNLETPEKLEILKEYIKKYNEIPKSRYKMENGFPLGRFCNSIKYNKVKISDIDKEELIQICPTFFE